jgi:hypothetical protein
VIPPPQVVDNPGSFALPQDSLVPAGERGSSNFDVRKRLALSALWTLPAQWKKAVWRDWSLSGILTLQTGQPFTVNSAIDVNGDGNLTDRLDTTAGLLGPAVGIHNPYTTDRSFQLTIDRSIVADSSLLLSAKERRTGLAGCLASLDANRRNPCDGAVGRNTFQGPGLANLDLALARNFRLSLKDPTSGESSNGAPEYNISMW